MIHALSSRKIIEPGDIVNIDVCGVYRRYHSDVCRTVSIGEPDKEVADYIAHITGALDVAAGLIVDGKPLVGKILPAAEAIRIYESIVRQKQDPALLTYAGRGVVETAVFDVGTASHRFWVSGDADRDPAIPLAGQTLSGAST